MWVRLGTHEVTSRNLLRFLRGCFVVASWLHCLGSRHQLRSELVDNEGLNPNDVWPEEGFSRTTEHVVEMTFLLVFFAFGYVWVRVRNFRGLSCPVTAPRFGRSEATGEQSRGRLRCGNHGFFQELGAGRPVGNYRPRLRRLQEPPASNGWTVPIIHLLSLSVDPREPDTDQRFRRESLNLTIA